MFAEWFPIVVAMSVAVIAAFSDIRTFRVSNRLTIPMFFAGLAYHGWQDGLDGLKLSLLGALFGFGVLIVPHIVGLMGAGDVKLLASIGAWLGLMGTLTTFIVSSLVAGIYAIVLIVYRGKLADSWLTMKIIFYRFAALGVYFGRDDLAETLCKQPDRRMRVIPYGAMIPIGIIGLIILSI